VRSSSSPDALLRLRAHLFAAGVPALLRLPLPVIGRLLEPARSVAPPDPERVRRTWGAVDAVLGGGSALVRTTCLTRGLTRYYFLRRAGVAVSLHFGVGMVDGAYAGHCWLSADGEPLCETRDPRLVFAETYRFAPRRGDA
jgi:hypothetical protein